MKRNAKLANSLILFFLYQYYPQAIFKLSLDSSSRSRQTRQFSKRKIDVYPHEY